MKVIVNGVNHETTFKTIDGLLSELDYEGDWLVTALNGEVIPANERASCTLKDADRIEILSPRSGG